ncbi:cytochrome P450 [Hyalangium rubrum]|uniref:Cytochrome P450 n=1 Tax=Hyalangium rubrum TaxID=3103134 RepID=A0ABU5HDA9_9BACT|nr:cytochrome P450 [Hyalangium sp. s54d21]MDY7230818.1 cytochrome P450 [Hyalangium sp. s54d21]
MTVAAEKIALDVVSPENLLDPNPLYKHLLESEPVYWSDTLQAWFVTRHEDVAACFRDPRLSAERTQLVVEQQLRGVGTDKVRDYLHYASQQMLMKDGAEHSRLRRQTNPGFTTQALDGWRPMIHRVVDTLLDRVQDMGRMDLVLDFSEPLPSLIIMEFFDIPVAHREDFQIWANCIARFFGSPVEGMEEAALRANDAMRNLARYLGALAQERRKSPGRDILSMMIQAQAEGRMDEDQLVANAILILTAGHVTTIDQLSNGVHALLTHPEQLQKLRENPTLLMSAVEEVLRYAPAVPFMHRIAIEDLELRGRSIRRGQIVFLGIAAANRDPSVFPEPDRFDITRANNKHLSFAFGPHLCLGAGLARRELDLSFGALLRRMPGLRLDEERPPRIKCNSLVFRGFDALPVRW